MGEAGEDDNYAFRKWSFGEEANYNFIKERYKNRQKIGEEALSKKKAFEKMKADDPLYTRAAVSAEMAQMRWDMAYMVAMNERMREYVESLDFVHQQISILSGAYQHTKLLADDARINYARIHKGLKLIETLTEELQNGITKASNGTDGAKG